MASPLARVTRAELWCLVVFLALVICAQAHPVKGDNGGGCSNNMCSSPNSYPPAQFILVHGMAGGAFFWFEVTSILQSYGSNVITVDLASHGINKAIADDVTTLEQYAKPLTDAIQNARGPVIVVGHSLSGGLCAYVSELFPEKITMAVYLSSCLPKDGQSLFGAYPSGPNGTFANLINQGFLSFNARRNPPNPSSATLTCSLLEKFYLTASPDKYVNLFKSLCVDTPFLPGTQPLSLTASKYGTVRRFYIKTQADKTVSPADQDTMIAANPPERVFCIPKSDHAPFFSFFNQLASILMCISGL